MSARKRDFGIRMEREITEGDVCVIMNQFSFLQALTIYWIQDGKALGIA